MLQPAERLPWLFCGTAPSVGGEAALAGPWRLAQRAEANKTSRLVRSFATAVAITPDKKEKRGSGFQGGRKASSRNHHSQFCFPASGMKHGAAESRVIRLAPG